MHVPNNTSSLIIYSFLDKAIYCLRGELVRSKRILRNDTLDTRACIS